MHDLARRPACRAGAEAAGATRPAPRARHAANPLLELAAGRLGGGSAGAPLEPAARARLAASFGRDLGTVRVHDDARAAESARALGARAYAVGSHVVFGAGEHRPGHPAGMRLLAHEVAHVVQQTGGEGHPGGAAQLEVSRPGDPAEADAGHAADAAAAGERVGSLARRPLAVHRAPDPQYTPPPAGRVFLPPPPPPVVDAPMAEVLDVMRAWRKLHGEKGMMEKAEPLWNGRPRILAAALAVRTEAVASASRMPEDLAELREALARCSAADRAEVVAQLPDAAVPAAPTVPSGGLPPAPAGSPHSSWPTALLETIFISFADRQAGMPGSRKNLDSAFWGPRPTDMWDALAKLGAGADVIKQVFDRWTAAGLSWSFVRSIRKPWGGSSLGFEFNATSVASLRAALEASKLFCKDKNGGDLYHAFVEKSDPCWREVTTPNTPGLHFCLGASVPTVHIDPHQVVEEREDDGTCNYDWLAVHQHFQDLGWLPTLPTPLPMPPLPWMFLL